MIKVNPRVDIAFKKIFGVEENKDLLISLINSVVGEEDQVAEVQLLNPYNHKHFWEDKLSILDIKAKGTNGKRFNIEIQISDEADYDKRALYYWAKLYTEQLKASDDYALLHKAIGIHILNFTSILGVEKYHNVFHIREKETGLPYFKDLELHTIELKKFCQDAQEDVVDLVAKVKTSLDRWVAFLMRHDVFQRDHLPLEMDTPVLKKALGVLDVMNFDEEERQAYEDRLKWLRIETNTLRNYEAKGFREGLEKGREEGREEGKAEGEKIAFQEKLAIAQRLLASGMEKGEVSQLTGLSLEQMESLRTGP